MLKLQVQQFSSQLLEFSRHFSKNVLKHLKKNPHAAQMDDDLLSGKKEMKLFVSDITEYWTKFRRQEENQFERGAPIFTQLFIYASVEQRRMQMRGGGWVDFVFRCVGREANVWIESLLSPARHRWKGENGTRWRWCDAIVNRIGRATYWIIQMETSDRRFSNVKSTNLDLKDRSQTRPKSRTFSFSHFPFSSRRFVWKKRISKWPTRQLIGGSEEVKIMDLIGWSMSTCWISFFKYWPAKLCDIPKSKPLWTYLKNFVNKNKIIIVWTWMCSSNFSYNSNCSSLRSSNYQFK